MTYKDKLEAWFRAEKASGRLKDLKFFAIDLDCSMERHAKAVFETLTGKRKTRILDTSNY